MVNRRHFIRKMVQGGVGLWVAGLTVACGREEEMAQAEGRFLVDGSGKGEIIMYDTYAMALYFDGGLGPKTGNIKVDYIVANQPLTLEFWHGHGGVNHKFTLLPEHFAEMKKMKKTYVETNVVADHKHKLFIDFSDSKWRVPGAKPVSVPVEP